MYLVHVRVLPDAVLPIHYVAPAPAAAPAAGALEATEEEAEGEEDAHDDDDDDENAVGVTDGVQLRKEARASLSPPRKRQCAASRREARQPQDADSTAAAEGEARPKRDAVDRELEEEEAGLGATADDSSVPLLDEHETFGLDEALATVRPLVASRIERIDYEHAGGAHSRRNVLRLRCADDDIDADADDGGDSVEDKAEHRRGAALPETLPSVVPGSRLRFTVYLQHSTRGGGGGGSASSNQSNGSAAVATCAAMDSYRMVIDGAHHDNDNDDVDRVDAVCGARCRVRVLPYRLVCVASMTPDNDNDDDEGERDDRRPSEPRSVDERDGAVAGSATRQTRLRPRRAGAAANPRP